jgi:hypothetical protein
MKTALFPVFGVLAKTRKTGKTPKMAKKRVPGDPKKQKKHGFWPKSSSKKSDQNRNAFFLKVSDVGPYVFEWS